MQTLIDLWDGGQVARDLFGLALNLLLMSGSVLLGVLTLIHLRRRDRHRARPGFPPIMPSERTVSDD